VGEYERLPEHRLSGLDDERLIGQVIAAREAGDFDQVRLAMSILAYIYYDRVKARVNLKVPKDSVDDVVQEVMAHALKSSFDGRSIGQFISWLNTITSRRIADFTERTARERDRQAKPLTTGEDDGHQHEVGVDGGQSQVEIEQIVAQALSALEDPLHRRVVELYGPGEFGFAEMSAREVVENVNGDARDGQAPMSETNVHKIFQRFRDRVREAMQAGGRQP
jgi:RNA polymerase sigma factor (sigma-70 family)